MSIEIRREEAGIRVRVDREGERAVSALLGDQEALSAMTEFAALLGYTVTPTGSTGDTVVVQDTASVEKKDES